MRLIFTPLAESDLEEIGDYIAQDNPRRALSFIMELRAQCAKIAATPQAYRLRRELGEGIRSCAYGRYVIFFDEISLGVRVIRVLHGSMDIESQFADKDSAGQEQ